VNGQGTQKGIQKTRKGALLKYQKLAGACCLTSVTEKEGTGIMETTANNMQKCWKADIGYTFRRSRHENRIYRY
jgi:hypothetical protein